MRRRNTIMSVFKTDENDENETNTNTNTLKKALKTSQNQWFQGCNVPNIHCNVAMIQPLSVRKKRSKIVPASARVITLYFLVGLCII